MLIPCPHCDQQIVPDEQGRCPLCRCDVESDVQGESIAQGVDETLDAAQATNQVEDETEAAADQYAAQESASAEQPKDDGESEEEAIVDSVNHDGGTNPYVAPHTKASPPASEALADLVTSGERIRPGFWGSLGLVFAVWLVQIVGGIAAFVVILVAAMIGGQLYGSLDSPGDLEDRILSSGGLSLLILFATGSVLVLAIGLCLFFGQQFKHHLSLRPFTGFQLFLLLMMFVPANLIAVQAAVAFSQLLPPGLQQGPDIDFSAMSWPVILLAICLFPAIGEELLFRGIIGRGLTARHGAVLGILLTSLLFGFAHLAPAHAFATFLLGLILHYVFVSTRSLAAPMLLHGLNNAAAMGVYSLRHDLQIPGYTDHADSLFVPPHVLVTCSVLLAGIGWAFHVTRTRWLLEDGSEWSPGYFSLERPAEGLGAVAVSQGATTGLVLPLLLLFGCFLLSLFLSALTHGAQWFVGS
jgi:membrane protease YdiL (CAAX protease family)